MSFALIDGVEGLERDTDRLSREAQPSLYDRLDWLRLHAEHAPPGGTLRVARASVGGVVAWLFLADEGWGRASAYASWYTLAFAPVFHGGDADARAALLVEIARGLRGHSGRLVLAPMPAEAAEMVTRAFRAAGWWVRAEESGVNWVAHVEGEGFAGYWARRPSRLRNTVRRRKRDPEVAILIHHRFDPSAWAEYEAVYAASWKPREGAPAFLRAMAQAEGAAGCLRLGIAHVSERPIAAQLWTVENDRATIHKLAYDEAERDRSPGTLLSEAMFAHVIDQDRPAIIDFGTGDDPYKAEWMDEKRPLYQVTLHDPRSAAGLAGAARAWIGRARRDA